MDNDQYDHFRCLLANITCDESFLLGKALRHMVSRGPLDGILNYLEVVGDWNLVRVVLLEQRKVGSGVLGRRYRLVNIDFKSGARRFVAIGANSFDRRSSAHITN